MAMQELYCKRSDNPSKEFIGNLNAQAKGHISKMCPLDKLVLNHTMFPQYARFVPLEQMEAALYRLEHNTCDVHHLFSVLPRVDGERYLRFCPLCAQETRETYGETYWRRKHQIRNMMICTKHKCGLAESSVPAKSEQGFTFCPAEHYISYDKPILEKNQLVTQYVSYLESVFDEPINFENNIPISSVLYDGMSRTKYLKPSGRSRYTKLLADDLNEFYKSLGVFNVASMYQIQRVLLGNRFDFSVICQLAFFLGMEPEQLATPLLTLEQIRQEQSSHYMKDTAPVDWELMDAETAPILEEIARSVYDGTANENERPERVSERLVYREMKLLGHQLENLPRCKAIFEKYTESYPESWARKIIWAYQKLKKLGSLSIGRILDGFQA